MSKRRGARQGAKPGLLLSLRLLFASMRFWVAIAFFTAALLLSSWVNNFTFNTNATAPSIDDPLFRVIPVMQISWAYDVLAIVLVAFFVIFAVRKSPRSIPYFFVLFGIAYLLRMIFVVLAPFGPPAGWTTGLFEKQFGQYVYGYFPSGHTQAGMLAVLLSRGWWRAVLVALLIVMVVVLLLARGHYTIDILAAMLFAVAIHAAGERWLRTKLTVG